MNIYRLRYNGREIYVLGRYAPESLEQIEKAGISVTSMYILGSDPRDEARTPTVSEILDIFEIGEKGETE